MISNKFLLYLKGLRVRLRYKCLGVEELPEVIMHFESDCIQEYGSLVGNLNKANIGPKSNKLKLDMKHRDSPPQDHLLRRVRN